MFIADVLVNYMMLCWFNRICVVVSQSEWYWQTVCPIPYMGEAEHVGLVKLNALVLLEKSTQCRVGKANHVARVKV